MRFPTLCLLVFFALCLAGNLRRGTAAPPQHPNLPNAWARFGVGSWKLVRVHSEILKNNGDVESVSTTETKTTLIEADNESYTLKVEVTVEVAGKRLRAEPKYVTYGLNGELEGQDVTVKQLGADELEINGRTYPTSVEQIVISGESTTSISTVHYSGEVPAHVLKRRTKVIDNETAAHNYETRVDVVAVQMPQIVLDEIKSASYVKTVESRADGSRKITLEVHCTEVPGGIVSYASRQFAADGVVSQRTTLELVAYESKPLQTKSRRPLRRRRLLKGLRRRRK